ncbi:hypothetical protein Q0590_36740 [Rhodocytophaga aerolata]|uniref:Uncharacterized protein n=1 Tax=Rhodocytophaga aerolata TaxID=455078 RepID=A0ABT8RIG5_9BACT|nr:hypothetical protein [Rhodocytophaga aerolata]MDO1451875.1 hypothetical protein [Rhodocytophaga aerolata]
MEFTPIDDLESDSEEHAVIIQFEYQFQNLKPLHSLAKKLRQVIEEAEVGEYDGHEIGVDNSDGILFMYGPDAELLFNAVKPILDQTPFMKGATAVLRFGPPEENVKEIEVII